MSGIVCDNRMPMMFNVTVYKTVIRPVLMYRSKPVHRDRLIQTC